MKPIKIKYAFDEAIDAFGDYFERLLAIPHTPGPARGYHSLSEWKKAQEMERQGRICPIHQDLLAY